MRKKQHIGMVTISGDQIHAYDTEGCEVKLTRNQRKAFMRYKSSEFLDIIKNEFQTVDISTLLDDNFFITKDSRKVYVLGGA
jgi:hypothetical protein